MGYTKKRIINNKSNVSRAKAFLLCIGIPFYIECALDYVYSLGKETSFLPTMIYSQCVKCQNQVHLIRLSQTQVPTKT